MCRSRLYCPLELSEGRVVCLAAAAGLIVFLLLWTAASIWHQRGIAAHRIDYNVCEFGAKGDGVAKDTVALQTAIDLASVRGGGVVVFPAGRYLSGTLHLRDDVSLRLSGGAVLIASTDDGDFEPMKRRPQQYQPYPD